LRDSRRNKRDLASRSECGLRWGQETPTLFDPMAVAFAIRPGLCRVTALHIRVDEKGYTREERGAPNAQVCLDSKSDDFFMFYLKRVGGTE
jgi:purine nucleosidase